jgi:hypothetical protein
MKRFNNWLAIHITKNVGTMYCAYLFAVIGIMGVVGAFTGNGQIVLIVGAISGYFLQLVLLPVIMVGQNITSDKSDKHHAEHKADMKKIHKHLGIK